jgi:hypothetical protein
MNWMMRIFGRLRHGQTSLSVAPEDQRRVVPPIHEGRLVLNVIPVGQGIIRRLVWVSMN